MVKALKNKDIESFRILVFVLPLIFYMTTALVDGPVWCVDSQSYVSMDFSREPVYPIFLMLFRKIFEAFDFVGTIHGQPSYLFAVVLVQSMLWVYSAYYLAINLYKFLVGICGRNRAYILGVIAVLFQMGVAALNRFVAGRGSMYSESIMTESLAMPLFVIFSVMLWKLFINFSLKGFVSVLLMTVLMSSIRKQMLITILVWSAMAFFFYLISGKRNIKLFMLTLCGAVISFALIGIIDRSYNLCVRGVFEEHIGNSKGALDTLLYTASAEDAALYEDYGENSEFPGLSDLYTEIYEECRERELLIDFAPGYELGDKSNIFNSDWVNMTLHYSDSYDVIGFEVVQVKCDDYVSEYFPELDGVQAQIKENQVEAELMSVLMKKDIKAVFTGHGGAVLYVLTANVVKAFVYSIANMTPGILIGISAFIYFLYMLIMVKLRLQNNREVFLLASIVILGIAINSVVTGSMIFPQGRYMCYGMGLFYLTTCCGILIR